MTREIRWRILSLQVVGVVVLSFMAWFTFWGNDFTHNQVSSQLAAQKVFFPPANSPEIKALPAVDAAAMKQYAGQQLTTGDQANVYANNFINVHLGEMGFTYSQISTKFLAMQPTDKNYASISSLRNTIFMGTMLRGTLLDAYAWWTVGTYALYAGFGLIGAASIVFLAFLFELLIVPRREGVVELKSIRNSVAAAGA
jgi:hypothetical protein